MSKLRIWLLKLVHRWAYPYPVEIYVIGLDRYCQIYAWLSENVGNMDHNVWANFRQRTYTFKTHRLRMTEIMGELRFKDLATATQFKLTFHDDIRG